MSWRSAPGAVATIMCGVLLGGCALTDSADAPASSPRTETTASASADPAEITQADFTAVQELMNERARALVAGDRDAFLASVDPGNEDLRQQQRTLYDNIQALPVAGIRYHVNNYGLEPSEVDGDDPTLRPELFEHLRFAPVFAKPISNEIGMTFVKRGDEWLVGAEERLALNRAWLGGPIESAHSRDVLVVTDAGAKVGARTVLESTAAALAAVSDVLGVEVHHPLLVQATGNNRAERMPDSAYEAAAFTQEIYALAGDGTPLRKVAAIAIRTHPKTVRAFTSARSRILRHELTHVLAPDPDATMPKWVTEGLAEFVPSYPTLMTGDRWVGDTAFYRGLLKRDVALPEPGRWGDDPTAEYTIARAIAEHLITTYGMPRYLRMMAVFRHRGRGSGIQFGADIVGEVIRDVYGVSEQEVARGAFGLIAQLARSDSPLSGSSAA